MPGLARPLGSEERRRRENDLGETIDSGTPYYARWLLAATKMLIDKGQVTPDELPENGRGAQPGEGGRAMSKFKVGDQVPVRDLPRCSTLGPRATPAAAPASS